MTDPTTERKVERYTRWATVVLDMPDAFTFVMEHLDEVEDARIEISPIWWHGDVPGPDGETQCERRFEVSIAGTPLT